VKYIDIHAHVNFKIFDEDRDLVIRRALDNNIGIINVGTQFNTSKKAVEMTNEYEDGVYATIGLHPIHTSASFHDEAEIGSETEEFESHGEIFDKEKYRELVSLGKVVAIGECGLDYFHLDEDSITKQKNAFISQIEFANEVNLPLMIHLRNNEEDLSRNVYAEALDILKKYSKVKGDIHFFCGTLEDAMGFIDFGFTISFTGAITYPQRKNRARIVDYDEVIKNIPLNMIMTDTDTPYVAPVPYRGKRNEPSYVVEIVKKIAEIKGLSEEEVSRTIVNNAKRVFVI